MTTPGCLRIHHPPKGTHRIIQLLQGFDEACVSGTSEINDRFRSLLEEPRNCILNCTGNPPFSPAALEKLRFLEQQLRAAGKRFRIVFASEALRAALGAPLAQWVRPTLLDALVDFQSEEQDHSGRQFIKAFVNATLRTFFVQARTEAKRGSIVIKSANTNSFSGDIAGVIQITKEGNGTGEKSYAVLLAFPKATFLNLVTRILGETHAEIGPENQDAAAEFLNIIFGQAKLVLNLNGAGLKPALPRIALPTEFKGFEFQSGVFTSMESGKTVEIPFRSDIGDFFIDVWLPRDYEDAIF